MQSFASVQRLQFSVKDKIGAPISADQSGAGSGIAFAIIL